MKPPVGVDVYNLIDPQHMVEYMWKYSPHMQTTQIPSAVCFEDELDFRILAQAVNVEIERNDCMRLRFFRDRGTVKQFFLPEYKLKRILVKNFKDRESFDNYFDGDAAKKLDVFKGETFRIKFFNLEGTGSGIYLTVSHMVMDAAATFIFFNDIIAVYDAMKNGTPMPRPLAKYEDVIKKELADDTYRDHALEDKAALEDFVTRDKQPPMFCGINGTKALDIERKLTFNPKLKAPSVYFPLTDKSKMAKLFFSKEDSEEIAAFVDENKISNEWLIQLGFRTFLSLINDSGNDTLFWVLNARRRTVKEKRCGGTIASPLPWREVFTDDMTVRDAIKQLSENQVYLFRHCDAAFTDIRDSERKLFGYNLIQSANSMMFSFLPSLEGSFGGRPYHYYGFNFSRYCMPLYTITLFDRTDRRYKFSYIYRTSMYKESEIDEFHNGVTDTILTLVRNPDKTINDIKEEILCSRN